MRLAVVLVHDNTSDDLERCLESLRRCPPACAYAVTVVDNASSEPGLAAVRARHPEAGWLMNPRNVGYARGCNQGMAAVDADYQLLLNPDIVVQPGAVDALLRAAEAHPKAGLIGPQLLNEDGSVQDSCRRFYTFATLLMRRTVLGRLFPDSRAEQRHLMRDFDHRSTRTVDWVLGGCLLVRRETLARVGPMDERFFLYFEDVDWCYRAWQSGLEVLYVHEARFVHRHRRASSGGLMKRSFWLHLGSLISFYEKWGLLVYLLKRWRGPLATATAWAVDMAVLNGALLGAYLLRALLNPWFADDLFPLAWYAPLFRFATLVATVSFTLTGRYRGGDLRHSTGAGERLRQVTSVTLLLIAGTYLGHQSDYSRAVLLFFVPLFGAGLFLGERLVRRLRERLERGYLSLERTLLVGEPAQLAGWLATAGDLRRSGLDAVGYLAETDDGSLGAAGEIPRLGRPGDLRRVVDGYRIVQVVFWDLPRGGLTELHVLAVLRARRIRLRWRVDAAGLLAAGAQPARFGDGGSIVLEPGSARPLEAAARRAAGFAVGLLLCLATAPAWLFGRLSSAARTDEREVGAFDGGSAGWRLRVVLGGDGRPCALPRQAPLAWALLRGRLALTGPPLLPAAADVDPRSGVDDPWLLARALPGLTGRWAAPTLGGRLGRAWRDPAGLSRFLRHESPEERL